MKEPRISIIVPVYNTAPYLTACLQALQGQNYPKGDFEILMVDNGSTDGSLEILRETPGIRLLTCAERGSYAARNAAAGEARGEILAFTDSDCLPDPEWLHTVEATFSKPEASVVLGLRLAPGGSGAVQWLVDFENKRAEVVLGSSEWRKYFGFTNNMAVRRNVFAKHGPFDKVLRGGDTLFVLRVAAGEGGGAIGFVPQMRVTHGELDSIRTYFKKRFIYGRSFQNYQTFSPAITLGFKDRARIFLATIREARYSPLASLALAGLLVGGLTAGSSGRAIGALSSASRGFQKGSPMNRRSLVIALFVGTTGLALAQGLVRHRFAEPFPALLMPDFAAPHLGQTTTVVLSVLEAESASGERLTAPARMLMPDAAVLPDSVLRLIAYRNLTGDGRASGGPPLPAWIQLFAGHRGGRTRGDARAVIDDPETTRWLRARTAEAFPGRQIVRASLIWREVDIDRDTEAARNERVVKRVTLFPR